VQPISPRIRGSIFMISRTNPQGPTPANGYRNRTFAGQALAELLAHRAADENLLVLALPRGGVPVAREIAQSLGAPLDVFMVRKVGLPHDPEIAMGAIATGNVQLLDEQLISEAQVPANVVAQQIAKENFELNRREALYRDGRPPLEIAHRSIVLVDDGIATGYTLRVAILALRQLNPARITVAVPVGAPDACELVAPLVDEFICAIRPTPFHAVGLWYDHFPPVSDDEVKSGLAEANRMAASPH
jgi:putative phosphoribosyl transferase